MMLQQVQFLAGSDSYTIVKEADKTALKKAIEEAKAKVKETSKYTTESIVELNTAVTKAEAVVNDVDATEAEVAEAVGEISKASAGLVIKKVETVTNNNKTITTAKGPKAQKVKSAKASVKGTVKVTWKKNSKASGYVIKVATNKKFTKNVTTVTIKKASKTSKTIKNLKKSKVYYVKMRAYVVANGKKTYGKYGTAKKVKVK